MKSVAEYLNSAISTRKENTNIKKIEFKNIIVIIESNFEFTIRKIIFTTPIIKDDKIDM